MVHETEYIDSESANSMNEKAAKINEFLDKEVIEITNDENMGGCVHLYVNGKDVFATADECEAHAYLDGMIDFYNLTH